MADNKTKRQLLNERMQQRYPDLDINDDEAVSGYIGADMDNYENENAQYRAREGELMDMFAADPRSASFLSGWRRGEDPAILLIKQFGPELRDALDDPANAEKLAQANAEYADKVAQNKSLEEEFSKNIQKSLQEIDAWQQQKGYTDEQVDQMIGAYVEAGSKWIQGIVSTDVLEKFMLAANYEGDVAAARNDGEVAGRNSKIEEKMRKSGRGDGVPTGFGSGGTKVSKGRQVAPANSRTTGGDIWSRGGERRIKHN